MQYKDILGGLILLSFSYGCGNSSADEKGETKNDSTPAPVSSVITIPADTSPVKQDVVINGQGVTTQPPAPTAVTSTKGALNPEHGKPGHRCDIAVGAPLDSKPTANYQPPATTVTTKPATTSPITISPATTTPAAPAASTTVAPGMNPAHGQPGHRCDIAVGAPLNSKPTTTTPATTQPVSLTTPTTTITAPPAPANSTTVAPGMNPAHGQPGHRCDIAVGAPLNSAPKKN